MNHYLAIVAIATFFIAWLGTRLVRSYAIKRQLMDVPNARSSHSVATPRGGGLAIVVSFLAAVVVLAALGRIDVSLTVALLVGGAAVGVIGFIDDRKPTPAGVRLGVHFLAALFAIYCLGGLPDLQIGDTTARFGLFGYVLGSVAIVWVLNLFNFMDGIDGIAASEAVFMGAGAVLLTWIVAEHGDSGAFAAALLLAVSCAGFLVWNWPPAKIFMGDVGSGFLGFCVAVLAMAAGRENPVAPLLWLILGGAFFVDATVTLVRRVARGERAQDPHRTHAYQWLSRRWGSHKRVTLTFIALNVFWLLPCAGVAALHPNWAVWILVLAFLPLIVLAIVSGAGRQETAASQ